ncbi:hypothetical protein F753_04030 [Stutzerimonas chloritidismutans AW-1]|jgi:hypothetical protein|uniref:Uncharacterized protein n=1 Tax=Stutzerimonas chloritidismutans AW-1 TaxID=1263865 RepID=V4QG15_STUCH|nr:hypothetical protein F753_04030 [Stutzerimonas chloritidismutans AW-1]
MSTSRRFLALVPLFFTPLVLLGINNMSSDKAIALIIPWIIFSIFHLILFLFLNKYILSTGQLILTSFSMALFITCIIALYFFSHAWSAIA